jgi:hypothetical protein
LNSSCSKVVPSHQPLSDWQKTGLNLTSSWQGRDIVLAIDLTPSVQLDAQGRLKLKEMLRDQLRPGDSVYIAPFATTVNPIQPTVDALSPSSAIHFRGEPGEFDRLYQLLPLEPNRDLHNTDIQQAEATIYQSLAQLNYCRLTANKNIRSQSVVWLTDAPLLTQPGISTETWNETPRLSPFRVQNSSESKERRDWLDTFHPQLRSQTIGNYKFSVVDIAPTVDEFCTLAPSGQQSCLINGYLLKQLWLPVLLGSLSILTTLVGGIWSFRYWRSLQQAWTIKINEGESEQTRSLRNRQKLAIGSDIECRGQGIRGYLCREGNKLCLKPGELPIYYKNNQVTQPIILKGRYILLSYPHQSRDWELNIKIN